MKCSSCGGNLKKDAYYCDNCGVLLAGSPANPKLGMPVTTRASGAKAGAIAIAVLVTFVAIMVGISTSVASTPANVQSVGSSSSATTSRSSSSTPTSSPTTSYSAEDNKMWGYGQKINSRFGVSTTKDEWVRFWSLNCGVLNGLTSATANSAKSFYLPDAISKLKTGNATTYNQAYAYTVAASALAGCPSKVGLWNATTWFDYQTAVYALNPASIPITVPNSVTGGSTGGNSGGGYSVTCSDGTISNSGGKQGACSWHGGVR